MTFYRFWFAFAFVLAVVPGNASAKKADASKEAPMSDPQYVVPATQINLADFGALVRAYTAPMGDRRIIVAVNYIRNLSGILEELPTPWPRTRPSASHRRSMAIPNCAATSPQGSIWAGRNWKPRP